MKSNMNRRKFIRTGSTLSAGGYLLATPLLSWAKTKQHKLTILHTNDWHSRLEPFDRDGGPYSGMGGAAVRAEMIKRIRKEEEHVLLLDSGDIFQGTPYFNYFAGEPEYKLMTAMEYDCVTLGNHDFDLGISGIVKQLPHAGFSFVNCNYNFRNTALEKIVSPYKIYHKGDLKIGIIGVGIELKGLVPDNLYGNIEYNDPIKPANKLSQWLKIDQKCDLVICLSHLGYEYKSEKISDQIFSSKSRFIDLILGGHTHTFMDEVVVKKNADGKDVVINQAGWAGLRLGRIDYTFNPFTGAELANAKGYLDIQI